MLLGVTNIPFLTVRLDKCISVSGSKNKKLFNG